MPKHEIFNFSYYPKEVAVQAKKAIRSLPGGYKDIAFLLYLREMKIKESTLTSNDLKVQKDIFYYGENDNLRKAYIQKVRVSLNFKRNPKGTKHTPFVLEKSLAQAHSEKNKKINYAGKFMSLDDMPEFEQDRTDYSAIDELTHSLLYDDKEIQPDKFENDKNEQDNIKDEITDKEEEQEDEWE